MQEVQKEEDILSKKKSKAIDVVAKIASLINDNLYDSSIHGTWTHTNKGKPYDFYTAALKKMKPGKYKYGGFLNGEIQLVDDSDASDTDWEYDSEEDQEESN